MKNDLRMARPPLTDQLVYLALKEIFSGNEIQPSTLKKIRKRIEKHEADFRIGTLIRNYGVESITQVAKGLLEDQVFGSRAIAKARFPELFPTFLSSQTNPPPTSEAKIKTSSTAAIQPTDSEPRIATTSLTTAQRAEVYSPEELLGIGERLKIRKEKEKTETIGAGLQAELFDSISLPLWDQHRILVRVQYALEKACFTFAQKRLAGVLQREGWDCAEAVELNRWPKVLLTYQAECNLNDVSHDAKPLSSLLDSIVQLRHNAVHRVRLSSGELLQHITDAGYLAQLLQDGGCSKLMSTIRQRTQDAIEKLVRNKQLLECKLADIKKEFAAKRAELERQELALMEAAVREHRKPVVSVSGSLYQLSDALSGTDEIAHAPWGRVCDDARPDNESSRSVGLAEPTTERKPEDEATKASDKDVEIINPPLALPVPAPQVDGGSVEPAILHAQKEAEKDEDEGLLAVKPCPTDPEPENDGDESSPEHISKDLAIMQHDLAMDTENAAEEVEKKPEIAAVFAPHHLDLQEYDKESPCEPDASLIPICIGNTGDDANQGHYKPPLKKTYPSKTVTWFWKQVKNSPLL
ncbi:hypothetical protein BDW02DRAFT_648068 [Decorospora gaudefroyi]|uniref:Uncharacterized protein n=1 Tax=Decorospora gaudefroyi TaxID=184978 RepID=A0A6A5K7S6_9PLEO|nr:hypothetical protein BDW02DRAFT_648068 [Decorospora gaudefroyi]